MQRNGLGIDLAPENSQQRLGHRRPLPAVPRPQHPSRPAADRRTTFSDKSPSVIGVSDALDSDEEEQQELSHVSERTEIEDEPVQQHGPAAAGPPLGLQPHAARARLNHRRSASVDLTNFKPQATGHGLQAANPAHLRVRSQLGGAGGGLTPPRTLGRPKSMCELPQLQVNRAPSPSSSRQPLGVASFLRQHTHEAPASFPNSHLSGHSMESSRSPSPSSQAIAQAHLLKAKSELNLRAAAASHRLSSVDSGSSAYGFDPARTSIQIDAPADAAPETVLTSPSIVESEFSAPHAEISEDGLKRNSTLLSGGNNTVRRQQQLSRLLAPEHGRLGQAAPLKKEAASRGLKRKTSSPVMLEQAKNNGKARVELDVALESGLVVEGGLLKGRMEVKVKSGGDPVWMSAPKVRIVGFEELASGDARHIFYHHAATISDMPSPFNDTKERYPLPCFEGDADEEGYSRAARGTCSFPMNLRLPIGKGAKGSFKSKAGEVRYIVIGSIKLKALDGSQRSIAHFYRHIDVFPYCDPTSTLRSLAEPLKSSSSKTMFMGGEGKVALTATIHRTNWVAGQQCYIGVEVKNDSSKKIKAMTVTLIRLTTSFRPKALAHEVDTESCQTQTNKKKVAETTLESGKKGAKGDVTAKGNWLGVDKGSTAEFMHPIQVPTDALSISRGKHLEVAYIVRVAVSASLGSELAVEIPITIHNFVSLDPPPGHLSSFTFNTAGQEMASPPKMSRQHSDVSSLDFGNAAGHGRPNNRLDHRSSLEFINTAIANAASRPQHRVASQAISLDEISEQEDRSPSGHETTASEAEWEASHRVLPLPENEEDEYDEDGSVDEIETVLSLERPLTSPIPPPPALAQFPRERRASESQPKFSISPPQPESFAFPSNNSPVRCKVSPEVSGRKSMGHHSPSPRRASVAGTKPMPSLKASPGSLRAHVVTPHDESSKFPHVDHWLKSSVTASVGSRSPSSGHATLASPPGKLLSPYSPNLGRFDHSPRSSPEPGLSPSEGYSTPSTVMAMTPPPEDDMDGQFGELQMDDTVTLSLPQTPKHMLRPGSASPHHRSFSVESGVKSRVAALESLSPAPSLRKAPSLYSDVSDASLKRIVRTQSTTSFKAPIWRQA